MSARYINTSARYKKTSAVVVVCTLYCVLFGRCRDLFQKERSFLKWAGCVGVVPKRIGWSKKSGLGWKWLGGSKKVLARN